VRCSTFGHSRATHMALLRLHLDAFHLMGNFPALPQPGGGTGNTLFCSLPARGSSQRMSFSHTGQRTCISSPGP